MKRKTVQTLCLATALCLSLVALGLAVGPANPTLTEKRFQAIQLAAPFPVDPALARAWVPPAFELMLDPQGQATGILALMDYPEYSLLRTPNSPPLEDGENVAPASIAHLWFLLKGPAEVLPVPGAQVTSATAYYYDVADLVTSPLEHRLYRRAGRAAILVSEITLVDNGQAQTGTIIFLDGSKITLDAFTPGQLPQPLKLGGNVWQWHVGGPTQMGNDQGVRRFPDTGNPSNVSTTRGQFLALVPGPPKTTQVTIHADPGTIFVDCFGATEVFASQATFFRLNNIALNWGRGELLWTTYPPDLLPVPPTLP